MSFNGHLLEGSRPKGWPTIVKDKFIYQAEDPDHLVEYLNKKAAEIKRDNGMTIILEPKEVDPDCEDRDGDDLKSDERFGNGKFVPMHMISYISYTVRKLANIVPEIGSDGIVLQ